MIDPAVMRPALADIAAVFHWSLCELKDLTISEIRAWRSLALERAGNR